MDKIYAKHVVSEANAFLCMQLASKLEGDSNFDELRKSKTPQQIIDLHLNPEPWPWPATRSAILMRMLESAQNRRSMPRVIGNVIPGGIKGLGAALEDFDPHRLLDRWDDPGKLLDGLLPLLNPQPDVNRRLLWRQFCRTILSAASFLARFPDDASFVAWVELFSRSRDTAKALPLVLAQEIDGFGVALAADFLKEMGFAEYVKPDVHINYIARELGLSECRNDYRIMCDMMDMADLAEMPGYSLDRIFWLIGSGRFYRAVGKNGVKLEVGQNRDSFIQALKEGRGGMPPA